MTRALGMPTRSPATAMVRATLLAVAIVAVAAVIISSFHSTGALSGSVIGASLAAVATVVPAVVMSWTQKWSPPAVMAAALGAYMVIVMLLGLAFAVLAQAAWLSSMHLGVTLMVAAAVGLAAQVWVVSRLRIEAFGTPGSD